MITKQVFFEDNLTETENIQGKEWTTEEDHFRSFLNGFDKAGVWEMIKLIRIFGKPESREDKLREMWTRIYEADQRRKQDEEFKEQGLE